MNDQAALASRWHRLARHTEWKVNAAWHVEKLTPLMLGAGTLAFALIVWQRTEGVMIQFSEVWSWLVGTVLLLILTSFLLARKYFITRQDALVRLESKMHLHNALSVAALGRGVWPELPKNLADGLGWRWFRVSVPFVLYALCWTAAFYLPVTPEADAVLPMVEPQAWQQMDDWLKKLEEEKIINPEEKEEQAAKIEALRGQEQEKWFSHESLNAGDTLKEQLQREIGDMARNMAEAERSLNALQNYAEKLSDQAKEQMLKEYSEALEGMKNGGMKLDPQLLKELAQIDPKNLKSLSPSQLNQLRKSLKEKRDSLAEMAPGKGFLGDGEGEDDQLAEGRRGLGQGDGEGPGKGDITRGPGSAPLTLSEEENNFGTHQTEAVVNQDMSKAQLGTLLNLQNGSHEVDKTYTGPQAAGSAQNHGQGGQQVWRESLTPDEKAVLKRVFN